MPTKRAPKLVQFDNSTPVGLIFQPDLFVRHAADLGPAVMTVVVQPFVPVVPTAIPPFAKGDQAAFPDLGANQSFRAIAFRPSGKRIVRSDAAEERQRFG